MTSTQGQVAAIATVIGSVLGLLHVTGIDGGMINDAVNGVFSILTLVVAAWAWWQHRKLAGIARTFGAIEH